MTNRFAQQFKIFAKYPYTSLLIVISLVGVVSDYLYPIFTSMGEIQLIISPGQILRGVSFFLLFILFIRGRLNINRPLLFAFIIFFAVSLAYLYMESEAAIAADEGRLSYIIKAFFIVLTTALVLKVLDRNEFTIEALVGFLIAWVVIFHAIPIIMSYFDIMGYTGLSYRFENRGLLFSINAITVILLATFPFYAIPSSRIGIPLAIIGFAACELTGTKAAAVGGFLIPILLLFVGSFSKNVKLLKTAMIITILIGVIFVFKDTILSVQDLNYDLYEQAYVQDGSFVRVLTSSRSDYYDDLHDFFEQNDFLAILIGSPDLIFNELDHLATLARFGILGLGVYTFLFLRALKMCASLILSAGWIEIRVAVALSAILTHSILGGHVIADAVASFPIAVVFGTAIFLTRSHEKDSGHRHKKKLW